ncbi:hypothetical protein A2U01_0026511 [Trifolium medium]|uniref:Uncharacterized protein n=1 Tax=Trifolium medium TaxID=97028 RepID=A0A392P0C0_9FABA|nr:hypothetical protein [Trifolium medium]
MKEESLSLISIIGLIMMVAKGRPGLAGIATSFQKLP